MRKWDCIMYLSQTRMWNQSEIEIESSFMIELYCYLHRFMLMYRQIDTNHQSV